MRRDHLIAALVLTAAALCGGEVAAQSLSPMRLEGRTPTDTKGMRLEVGNPYDKKMTFSLVPMDATLSQPVGGAEVRPNRVTLGPGMQRTVLLAFQIPPNKKDRTIALCVQPENLPGPVVPRVCGAYRGISLARLRN